MSWLLEQCGYNGWWKHFSPLSW